MSLDSAAPRFGDAGSGPQRPPAADRLTLHLKPVVDCGRRGNVCAILLLKTLESLAKRERCAIALDGQSPGQRHVGSGSDVVSAHWHKRAVAEREERVASRR